MTFALVALLGLTAGFLTTVAGMGGGLMLVTSLAIVWGPHVALPVTALALLVGNLHRLYIFRSHLRMEVGGPLVLGMIPGSLLGAALVADLPAALLQLAMLALVALALARVVFRWEWVVPRAALAPAGGAVGVMASAGGGAAVLTSPLILSAGIAGDDYMATVAFASVAMHVSRTVGYGATGLVVGATFAWAALLAVALVAGNLVGSGARGRLPPTARTVLEYGVLIVAAVLSVAGVA
jgi:uncharacterized membrane protein YfcA